MKEAFLYLYDQCSYKCDYCMLGNPSYKPRTSPLSETQKGIEKMVKFFDERGEWRILLSGGEPTEHPFFIELVEKLSTHHRIRLDTNNSMSDELLDDFVRRVASDKVDFIHCSLHEKDEETERLKAYIDRLLFLKSHGFKVFVTYVATPARIKKLDVIFNIFKGARIPFVVVPLRTAEYPGAYTLKEREILDRYMISFVHSSYLDIDYRRVNKKLCSSGYKRINIDGISGCIYLCWRKKQVIGNLYENELNLLDEPLICDQSQCTYYFEPHLSIEDMIKEDIHLILSDVEAYNVNKKNEFIASSL